MAVAAVSGVALAAPEEAVGLLSTTEALVLSVAVKGINSPSASLMSPDPCNVTELDASSAVADELAPCPDCPFATCA